jgi:ubiquinone/menaquinone biosynthesis C-methylase UbiE
MKNKTILDCCCGSKMFYFEKQNKDVLFGDIRNEGYILCDGRKLEIKPDMQIDFRNMPFDNNSFKVVIFDPPHLHKLGKNSWMAKKYGVLSDNWQDDIKKGFKECFRVLEDFGVLVFKWNETQIKVSEILKLTEHKPLIGHKSGKRQLTHWILFIKQPKEKGKHD